MTEPSPRSGRQSIIWIEVKRVSYRLLRRLHRFLIFDPGAYAPGFMLPSASRTKNT
jgi:hypothetical protein